MEKPETYTDNYHSFTEWMSICLKGKENVYPRFFIPYEEWKQDYINNIESKSDAEIKRLLRILLQPFTLRIDQEILKAELQTLLKRPLDYSDEQYNQVKRMWIQSEQNYRMLRGDDAWEGLTWIIRLLEHSPLKAQNALKMYLDAEIGALPDDRIYGIFDCIDIIQAKYIMADPDSNKVLSLSSREFEELIAMLYERLGYKVQLTKATRDGGKDVIATIKDGERNEIIYVECKLYRTSKITAEIVRSLGYV